MGSRFVWPFLKTFITLILCELKLTVVFIANCLLSDVGQRFRQFLIENWTRKNVVVFGEIFFKGKFSVKEYDVSGYF